MHGRERICLIVDGEPLIRTYLGTILKCAGIQSIEAEDGVDALRILKKLGTQIDLLITDIGIPGAMDGVDLAHCVTSWFPALPVILVSDSDVESPAGFSVVRKPYMPDLIWKAVEEAIPPPTAQAEVITLTRQKY